VLYLLLQGFADFSAKGNMGQNSFGDQGSGYAWWAAFLLELVMTAVFVTVILAVTDERNEHPALAPLAIGFTLAAIHLVAIPAPEPIVQDGWQWDPVGQQWHPVGSTPEQWRAQQAAEQAAQASAEGETDDGGTRIRPPS